HVTGVQTCALPISAGAEAITGLDVVDQAQLVRARAAHHVVVRAAVGGPVHDPGDPVVGLLAAAVHRLVLDRPGPGVGEVDALPGLDLGTAHGQQSEAHHPDADQQ